MQGSIASVVKAIRSRRNLTGSQLGKVLGVTCGAISQYEQGRITPRRDILLSLAGLAETELETATIARMLEDKPVSTQETEYAATLYEIERALVAIEKLAKRRPERLMSPENRTIFDGMIQRLRKQAAIACLMMIEKANPNDPRIGAMRDTAAKMPDGTDVTAEYLRGDKPAGAPETEVNHAG